jgi:hypothetical protein
VSKSHAALALDALLGVRVDVEHHLRVGVAGSKFENGVLVERPDESTSGDTHAA